MNETTQQRPKTDLLCGKPLYVWINGRKGKLTKVVSTWAGKSCLLLLVQEKNIPGQALTTFVDFLKRIDGQQVRSIVGYIERK